MVVAPWFVALRNSAAWEALKWIAASVAVGFAVVGVVLSGLH